MLSVILLPALNFCIMARGSAVLDAVVDIDVGVDALTDVVLQGLIDLLVDVTVVASAARWAREASVLILVSFVVASGPSIEIGASRLIARAFRALALTSPVMARATGVMTTCRCSRVWSRILDLVDLDLGRFKMCSDLFDFWSL